MLALDFDGVVCDALLECAAVTWHAVHSPLEDLPALLAAVAAVPVEFLRTFGSVRPLSRTLDDFMVSHAVTTGGVVDRKEFEAHRARVGRQTLSAQATAGEQVRGRWRETEPEAWLALHTVYAEVAAYLRQAGQEVAIVSAKDAASVEAILAHHDLSAHVARVAGSCVDKTWVLAALRDELGSLVFVDDNLTHVRAAGALPGIDARWALWGYHTAQDLDLARTHGVTTLDLSSLSDLDIALTRA